MTTDELKDYLNMTGWGSDETDYHIRVYRNGWTVAEVGLLEQYSIKIFDPTQMTDGLYRRLSKFAHTPVGERENEKKYNVILPNILRDRKPILLCKSFDDHESCGIDWSPKDWLDDNMDRHIFTEQEIKDIDERYLAFKVEVTPE